MIATATSDASVIQKGEPFSEEKMAEIKKELDKEGYCQVPGVLTPPEIEALKAALDRIMSEQEKHEQNYNLLNKYIGLRLFELDPIFEELISREPLISLAEAIVGKDCHAISQNSLCNPPGEAVDKFHVDDAVYFPLPQGVPRHDPRITMPIFILNAAYTLTDVPSLEYGPTQVVPGSHYAGRGPNDMQNPVFEGKGPVSLFSKAGDLNLFNNQMWHRGAPNTSNERRYMTGIGWSPRFMAQRFFPYVNYQLPPGVVERADARRRRVLGFHDKGAYG